MWQPDDIPEDPVFYKQCSTCQYLDALRYECTKYVCLTTGGSDQDPCPEYRVYDPDNDPIPFDEISFIKQSCKGNCDTCFQCEMGVTVGAL